MPSPKPEDLKSQQPQARLTSRRSFGSADSNYSLYDLDNVIENTGGRQINEVRKDKGIPYNNIPQSMGGNSNQQNNSPDNNKTWWEKYNPSLTLENKASVARDHLANERTFLAWLRTSLSFISIGIAITQLFRLKTSDSQLQAAEYDQRGKTMGLIFLVLGILFLSFGITRYFRSQYLMTKGYFPASRGSIIMGAILTVLVLAVVVITNYKII